ncbi:mersacidin/lichenicidin family type 2 lantibiotic [Granulicella aggregans]|uniref:Mersacidin/lichenicidin family type 2 lantibiotic n=1 Tax=Granulicella aggregans TaxID=474949 RepID=A0A7W7ZIW2_9BACT|nr:mersacidin/lichenicidin family type 2 lantibiotic [Granulicella aggregans]
MSTSTRTTHIWKNPEARASLTDSELIDFAPHPSGSYELSELELAEIVGASTNNNTTDGCCSPSSKNCGTCGNASSGCCGGGS